MNEQQNIKFVLEVEKYPCLYNHSISSYYRRSKTDKAWEEIGKVMNMTGIACKEKWRNLRVVFMRHMKLQNSSGSKKMRPYYLLDVMKFLTPFVKRVIPLKRANLPFTSSKEGTDNIDDISHTQELSVVHENHNASENNEENNDLCSSNTKSKNMLGVRETDKHVMDYSTYRSSALYEYNNLNDPVKSFLDSLAPELKEMNLQQFKIFKRRVLALVDDIMETCGTTTPTATFGETTTTADTATSSKIPISVSASNCLDVGFESPDENSNSASSSLLVEIKAESEL